MRHGDVVKKLGRTAGHRRALVRNLVAELIRHERIRTTYSKARVAGQFAERLVHHALNATPSSRRNVAQFVSSRDLVRKLFEEVAPRFAGRSGGYTRIYRLGPRPGDSAEMALLEFTIRKAVVSGAGEQSGRARTRAKQHKPQAGKSRSSSKTRSA